MTTILDLINTWEQDIITALLKNGEYDGCCHIGWVDDLNGVCEIGEFTDVLGVFVSRKVSGNGWGVDILMHDADDRSDLFVDIRDLPLTIADEVYRKIMCYYGK